jgi:hypothetical protein
MAERIVNLLQAVHIHHKEQHSPAGSAPNFQLAFCQGHKAASVIQAREFVSERKIAQFCLQHVLFRGTADRAHQKLADRLTPSVTWQRTVRLRAYVSQQTCEFSIRFRKESLENVTITLIFSAR